MTMNTGFKSTNSMDYHPVCGPVIGLFEILFQAYKLRSSNEICIHTPVAMTLHAIDTACHKPVSSNVFKLNVNRLQIQLQFILMHI